MEKGMKIAAFTDIHFGKHQNSEEYLSDCLKVLKTIISSCRKENIDTIVFCGDWFNDRVNINARTLSYSVLALRMLNRYLDDVGGTMYLILGNHDLFYRNSRNISSLEFAKEFSNIVLIDRPTNIHLNDSKLTKISLMPWLEKDEDVAETIHDLDGDYLFCHGEFRSFRYNKNSVMLTGGIPIGAVKKFKHVFSGHYHLRQTKNNITYVGSLKQQDMGDAGTKRGWMILDTVTGKVDFRENTTSPKFIRIKMSDLETYVDDSITGNFVKIIEDVDLKSDEFSAVHDMLMEHNPLGLTFESVSEETEDEEAEVDEAIESVDELLVTILTDTEGSENKVRLLGKHL